VCAATSTSTHLLPFTTRKLNSEAINGTLKTNKKQIDFGFQVALVMFLDSIPALSVPPPLGDEKGDEKQFQDAVWRSHSRIISRIRSTSIISRWSAKKW